MSIREALIQPMNTLFANSPDGTRIAYACTGTGPAIMLIHGGGGSRHEWHEASYVRRLHDDFTVITPDLRGHGESDLLTDPADYTTDKLGQDILAVADACRAEQFLMWGMSYGGKVSRYLAVQSERVTKFIMMGTPLGLGVSGQRRQEAIDFCAHWPPIVQALLNGTLDLASLSQDDRNLLRHFHVPAMLGWVKAMLDWPSIEPADFRCPTLWLIGSEDPHAMVTMEEFKGSLEGTWFQVHIVEGLDHNQVFDDVDRVFPTMHAFTIS
jgi:pimeloyl-ACP methyl ester carboxylesterase